MELTLERKWRMNDYSIGRLYIDGEYVCNTLEDTDRNLNSTMGDVEIYNKKVPGKTAIPYGRYRITLDVISPKYSKKAQYKKIGGKLPRLLDVPGFSGILIHIGNFPEDTEGCILVGENTVKGAVMNSARYFWLIYDQLAAVDKRWEKIYLTIKK